MKSIASKFNLLSIFLIVLTALVTGGYIIWQHQINAFNNFTQHGEETAVMLAKNTEYGVYTENQQAIEQALQGLEENPDIAYVIIFNKQRKVLAQHNYRHLSNLVPLPTAGNDPNDQKVISRTFKDAEHRNTYIDVVAPVYMQEETSGTTLDPGFETPEPAAGKKPELIGIIQLGISQERIYQGSRQFMLQTLTVVPITMLVGIALTLYQTRRMTRPIKKLLLATQTISKGHFGTELVPSSKDEIGALTVAFNTMSRDLANYQAEAIKQRETLEEQVTQRTLDLQHKTNEAYQLARKAEAASKAKSEFIATMSHEIRTPMNGVLGMTELLLNTELTTRQKRLAETAYHSAKILLEIINNILDFSKIESGKFQINIDDFDLRHLLEETTEMLATQAHNKGLELVLNLPVNLHGMVRGDSDRLRQVLVNLLGNAIKFTQGGEVQLKASWQEHSEPDKYMRVLFEVTDTGPGIAAEKQQSIFESFTQADGSITRRYGGTGLGLTISKQLVQMMGGQLELASSVGQGSRFYFSLSLECSTQLPIKKTDIGNLRGLNVLIVDDNATNREILQNQLTHWGINCACVASGAEAIRHLLATTQHDQRYQVMLLDWHMPDMDGLTLATTINSDKRIPPLSLVMLSSDTVTFDEQKDHHGIRYFLNKPVLQRKLLDCLLELLGTSPIQAPHQPPPTVNTMLQLKGNILLVEDNLVNQEVGMGILGEIGCQVDVANNGLEAIEATANKRYDLILMDCHMPEMDGFEASRQIRQREQHSGAPTRIPIIALTADVQKGITDQCREAGMDDYLSKPFSQKQLQEVLNKWLPAAVSQPAAPKALPAAPASPSRVAKLNPEALDNLRHIRTATGETLLHRAVTLFLNSAPGDVQALRRALDQRDSGALYKIAHSFKSACGNLGAHTLQENAAAIEAIAKQGHSDGIAALLATMEADLPGVIEALRQEIDSPPATAATAAPRPAAVLIPAEDDSKPKHILLVDDDENFRSLTHAVLTASAFSVDMAHDGAQALAKINQRLPDMVLLDAIMEGMDGFEVCRVLRADPRLLDIPIVMITGLGDMESINRAFDAGATDFIVKPINYPILIHQINFIFKASRTTAQLRLNEQRLQALNDVLQESLRTEQELKEMASRFVPNEFLSLLGHSSLINVRLGDARQQTLSVLFGDIRGFSSLSEGMTPQENFTFINNYLSHMQPIIAKCHGFIDKYIGDGIMALFGGVDDALNAAIAMLKRLEVYNKHRGSSGYAPIKIGIGINTGTLMLGMVGTEKRMDGTVIGDAVNLAARIEGLTKLYSTPLLLTHHAFSALEDPEAYAIRLIDQVKVKGKTELVTVYEVFDADPIAVKAAKLATEDLFAQALSAYQAQDFGEAQSLFEQCLDLNPEDTVSQIYLERTLQQA